MVMYQATNRELSSDSDSDGYKSVHFNLDENLDAGAD